MPVIFKNENEYDDIHSDIEWLNHELKISFYDFTSGHIIYLNPKANDIEKVFDSDYNLNEKSNFDDMYAVTLKREWVESQIMYPFSTFSVSVPIPNEEKIDDFAIENIIEGFEKYPFDDDKPFIDPFAYQIISLNAHSNVKYIDEGDFPLSKLEISSQNFVPRFSYYVTRINPQIIQELNEEELNNQLEFVRSSRNKLSNELSDEVKRNFEEDYKKKE